MTIWRLVIREIAASKVNVVLALAAVAVAAGFLVAAVTHLHGHDIITQRVVEAKKVELKVRMDEMKDRVRKSMKRLGFNIYIYPEQQDMREVYEQGFASATMPEDYAHTLANSNLLTINHLLPMLTRRLSWPEQKRQVLVVGVRDEVPLSHRDPLKPLLPAVPSGSVILGHLVHTSLDVKQGGTMAFQGKTYDVAKCYGERGTRDDDTIWMNLGDVQTLVGEEGRINALLALECNCATINRLGEIRDELAKLLPNIQVHEHQSIALVRAEEREAAKKTALRELDKFESGRRVEKARRERTASILNALVLLGASMLVGLLTFGNVRERRGEIAVLRAIGLRSSQILFIFLNKAVMLGFAGAVVGTLGGWGIGWLLFGGDVATTQEMLKDQGEKLVSGLEDTTGLFGPWSLLLVVVCAPLVTAMASWLPALSAAGQDPADILREE